MNLLRCGCDWDGESVHYCADRPKIYTMPRVDKIHRQETPACTCKLPRYKRHTQPWECIPQEEIDQWQMTTGCSPRTARHLYWMSMNFSTPGTTRSA